MKCLTRTSATAICAALVLIPALPAQADGDVLAMKISGRQLSAIHVGVDPVSDVTLTVVTPAPEMALIVVVAPVSNNPIWMDPFVVLVPLTLTDENGMHESTWTIPASLAVQKFDIQAFSATEDGLILASPRVTIGVGPLPADYDAANG